MFTLIEPKRENMNGYIATFTTNNPQHTLVLTLMPVYLLASQPLYLHIHLIETKQFNCSAQQTKHSTKQKRERNSFSTPRNHPPDDQSINIYSS